MGRHGKKISEVEWESVKLRVPAFLISFLDGKEEFTIFERTKPEKRKWTLQDIDGFLKKLYLSSHVVKKRTDAYSEVSSSSGTAL